MKRIMIIPGGKWQVPLIKKAKEMGLFVINTNIVEDCQGKLYSDTFVKIDVLDKKGNFEVAKNTSPDAVVTDQSDIAVPVVAYICEEMNLPGIGCYNASLFTNKFLMREFCKSNGFNAPLFFKVNTYEEAKHSAQKIGYPIIIKPLDNQASKGVFKVQDEAHLEECYNSSVIYSKEKGVLIEEFIGGVELTIEGFKFYDRHTSLGVSVKDHYKSNEMVANSLSYKPSDLNMDFDTLKIQHDDLVNKMNLKFGITHAEYKFFNHKFYLIEVAARGGGTLISSHVIPAISGIDANELLIRCALGEKIISSDYPIKFNKFASLEFFNFKEGVVKDIKGLDLLNSNPNIIDFGLNFSVGSLLKSPDNDSSRQGHYLIKADTAEELEEVKEYVKKVIEVIYE